jgi:hypothetical protein
LRLRLAAEPNDPSAPQFDLIVREDFIHGTIKREFFEKTATLRISRGYVVRITA